MHRCGRWPYRWCSGMQRAGVLDLLGAVSRIVSPAAWPYPADQHSRADVVAGRRGRCEAVAVASRESLPPLEAAATSGTPPSGLSSRLPAYPDTTQGVGWQMWLTQIADD